MAFSNVDCAASKSLAKGLYPAEGLPCAQVRRHGLHGVFKGCTGLHQIAL